MKHVLSILVENKSGVLSRVIGLISASGFNIESLTVAPTENVTMSRMTIIVDADEVGFEQITKQLNKLVSVYKIHDLTDEDAIERELALFKVCAPAERRPRGHRNCEPFPRQSGRRSARHRLPSRRQGTRANSELSRISSRRTA